MDARAITSRILNRCRALGFALAGVCPVRPSDYEPELRAWLDRGAHGEMAYLKDQFEDRLDPDRVLPGTRSVVMVADRYASRDSAAGGAAAGDDGRSMGRIARYARGRDYHRVIKKRLHALADELREVVPGDHGFRSFVDSAPVLEREHAARAGLGWVGKHTLVIHPVLGSYTLLGGIYTTLELSVPVGQQPAADACGTCTRCIDACPTDAITPYSVDASRCISYLTLEHRAVIDAAFYPRMGDWLAGCDICQEVCPHNSPRPTPDDGPVNAAYWSERVGLPILDVLRWDADDRRAALASSALKRVKLDMFRRNAAIVAGNLLASGRLDEAESTAIEERLRELGADPSQPENVRDAAAWAITQRPA